MMLAQWDARAFESHEVRELIVSVLHVTATYYRHSEQLGMNRPYN